MNQSVNSDENDDLRPEYDFSDGVRGKHYEAYRKGTNIVFLDPDVARVFKDSASVNRALRLLLKLAKEQAATEE
jgi:hypothetical protein